jgi:hypothetical protein
MWTVTLSNIKTMNTHFLENYEKIYRKIITKIILLFFQQGAFIYLYIFIIMYLEATKRQTVPELLLCSYISYV